MKNTTFVVLLFIKVAELYSLNAVIAIFRRLKATVLGSTALCSVKLFAPCSGHCYRLGTLKMNKVEMLFYAMLSDFQKSIAFWKVPRLRPFAFLVRATSR